MTEAELVVLDITRRVDEYINLDLPITAQGRLLGILSIQQKALEEAWEARKRDGPPLTEADTEEQFREKLTGLMKFARMAFVPTERGDYEPAQIIECVEDYGHLVLRFLRKVEGSPQD